MYNFHVKEWKSYFVGEVRVYVHNGRNHPKKSGSGFSGIYEKQIIMVKRIFL